jgi:hypothetical protein
VIGCAAKGGYQIPKATNLRDLWIEAIRRQERQRQNWKPTKDSRVCSDHFAPEDFRDVLLKEPGTGDSGEGTTKTSVRLLRVNAVPTIFPDLETDLKPLEEHTDTFSGGAKLDEVDPLSLEDNPLDTEEEGHTQRWDYFHHNIFQSTTNVYKLTALSDLKSCFNETPSIAIGTLLTDGLQFIVLLLKLEFGFYFSAQCPNTVSSPAAAISMVSDFLKMCSSGRNGQKLLEKNHTCRVLCVTNTLNPRTFTSLSIPWLKSVDGLKECLSQVLFLLWPGGQQKKDRALS